MWRLNKSETCCVLNFLFLFVETAGVKGDLHAGRPISNLISGTQDRGALCIRASGFCKNHVVSCRWKTSKTPDAKTLTLDAYVELPLFFFYLFEFIGCFSQIDDGSVGTEHGLLVERCRFLEASGCASVCMNTCKVSYDYIYNIFICTCIFCFLLSLPLRFTLLGSSSVPCVVLDFCPRAAIVMLLSLFFVDLSVSCLISTN